MDRRPPLTHQTPRSADRIRMSLRIGRYQEKPATCRDYDPRFSEVARLVASLIHSEYPFITVEHIGSTAVEGCRGKGIIDLMALYPDDQWEQARAAIDSLGFQRQTTRDPFPEDRPMRVGSIEYDGDMLLLHVHVIAQSAEEARVLLSFRDRLRQDAALRAAYTACKEEIISSGITDSVDYSIAKGEFINRALSGANC
ncbi:MAG: GrpB family protein [Acidobacteriota bacterium]